MRPVQVSKSSLMDLLKLIFPEAQVPMLQGAALAIEPLPQ